MKKTIVAIAALLITAATYGQGTVNFANNLSGVFTAPITLKSDPTVGVGSINGAVAQLFVQNGTSVTPVGSAIGFRTTSAAAMKFFDGGALTIPGTSPGGSVNVFVRVSGGNLQQTDSPIFAQKLGGDTLPAENMVNMTAFSVALVPEPTTIALGVPGAKFCVITFRASPSPLSAVSLVVVVSSVSLP